MTGAANQQREEADRPDRVVHEGTVTTVARGRAGEAPARAPGVRLRPTVEPFGAPDGNVYLIAGGGEAELVVKGASAPQRALLELLSAGG